MRSTPSTSTSRSPKRLSSGTLLVIATVVVGIAISVFGIYKLRGWKRPMVSFENFKATNLTTNGKVVTAAISPDGKDFAYVTADGGKQTLSFRPVATNNSNIDIVPSSEGDYLGLSFSPDGKFIYYVRSVGGESNDAFKIPAAGGAPVRLVRDVASAVALSTDGKHMAYVRNYPAQTETALIVSPIDGFPERKLAVMKSPSGFVINSGPAWSPDDKQIAALSEENGSAPYQQVVIIGVADGRVRSIDNVRWPQIGRASWVHDGNSLVVTASEHESPQELSYAQVWQISYPSGQTKRITNDLADYHQLTLTRDSRQILVIQNERQANLSIAPAGDEQKAAQITSGNSDGFDGLSFAPDGRISYSAVANGEQNLWMIDSDGKNPRQLTNTQGINRTPSVSPDRKFVVFSSDRSGAMHLWRIDIDGNNPVELTHGEGDAHPQITPDGKWVIYRSYKRGNPNLFRVSINGGTPIALTDGNVGPPDVSPDGKFIACSYRGNAISTTKLVVISIDGGEPLQGFEFPPDSADYRWASDGRSLTYVRTVEGTSNIWRQPLDGGPPQQITNFNSEQIFATDWSSEGKWLVYSKGKRISDAILLSGI